MQAALRSRLCVPDLRVCWGNLLAKNTMACRRQQALFGHLVPGAASCRVAAAPLAGTTSTVSCACGGVRLLFHVPRPRNRIPCCCWDCRQKCIWATSQGGPALPPDVLSFDAPMDLIYFPNSFELQKGSLDDLEFCTLRADDGSVTKRGWRGDRGSINMVTLCCRTTLLVDNVNYHASKDLDRDDGAQVLLFPAVIHLETEMIDMGTTLNFPDDYPPDKVAALKKKLSGRAPPVSHSWPKFLTRRALHLYLVY